MHFAAALQRGPREGRANFDPRESTRAGRSLGPRSSTRPRAHGVLGHLELTDCAHQKLTHPWAAGRLGQEKLTRQRGGGSAGEVLTPEDGVRLRLRAPHRSAPMPSSTK